MPRDRVHGVSLIEVLIGIAIAAILAGIAIPSFVESIARSRLDGVVGTLAIDLQYARSEAIRRRTTATLAVIDSGATYTLSYRDESNNAVLLKTVPMPDGVTLSASDDITFDSLRGTTSAQTVTGTSSALPGTALRVTTTALGRVSTCLAAGAFSGYTAC